ncbi:MAG: VOC family protein [Sphingobium sp.]|nr:VOC family protein [Sphingobium sp.]
MKTIARALTAATLAALGSTLMVAVPAAAQTPALKHFMVAVSVKDLKAETDFYVGKLGFKLVKDVSVGGGRVSFRWLELGNERLELIHSPTAVDSNPVRAKPTAHAGLHGYTHFTMETTNLEATRKALLAKGVTLAVDTTEVKDLGIKAIYVTDPEGNAVEIIQRVTK